MIFGPMAPLAAECVQYIAYHTAGTPDGNDTSAGSIHAYHRSKGWAGIGYHFVIRTNGDIEIGRPLTAVGAHVKGLNDCSLGIAFSGNGDIYPLTPAQVDAGVRLGVVLMVRYGVPVERVIGHREVNALVHSGILDTKYLTPKSCPGTKVSMAKIRRLLSERLNPPPSIASLPVDPPDHSADLDLAA